MSTTGTATAPDTTPEVSVAVPQNVITLKWNDKKDAAPKLNSVLAATQAFVNNELRRKQEEQAIALLTDAEFRAFTNGTITSLKEFFENNNRTDFPNRGGYQSECALIQAAFTTGAEINSKSLKVFTKKLAEVGEKREASLVFGEVMETYRNDTANKYRDLLG